MAQVMTSAWITKSLSSPLQKNKTSKFLLYVQPPAAAAAQKITITGSLSDIRTLLLLLLPRYCIVYKKRPPLLKVIKIQASLSFLFFSPRAASTV
jgi:hypothetical protein